MFGISAAVNRKERSLLGCSACWRILHGFSSIPFTDECEQGLSSVSTRVRRHAWGEMENRMRGWAEQIRLDLWRQGAIKPRIVQSLPFR